MANAYRPETKLERDVERPRGVLRTRDTLERLLATDEGTKAVLFLAADGAALEVGTHARNSGVSVFACELELDVAVELSEADVAADIVSYRA
jgi:hypothetical protein